MTKLREEILFNSPKVVSNLALALLFWVARYIVLITIARATMVFDFWSSLIYWNEFVTICPNVS